MPDQTKKYELPIINYKQRHFLWELIIKKNVLLYDACGQLSKQIETNRTDPYAAEVPVWKILDALRNHYDVFKLNSVVRCLVAEFGFMKFVRTAK